jgi:hypothetical protein
MTGKARASVLSGGKADLLVNTVNLYVKKQFSNKQKSRTVMRTVKKS